MPACPIANETMDRRRQCGADVIPNGVDISKFLGDYKKALAEAKWALAADDLVVTAVGRMTSQKGFDYLLKAFPRILQSEPKARLLLIGDGYMRSELEALARKEGIADRVTFAGFISDGDLVSTLRSSNVVVVPSRFEPFGIVALEAMAAGAPVVVSGVGGLAEIVDDNVDGLEVEPGNPRAIADAVVRVLSDPEAARGFVARAKEKLKSYTWVSAAEATLGAYQRAIGEAKYG